MVTVGRFRRDRRDGNTTAGYHGMSAAQKSAVANGSMAEPPVRCPGCDVATPPADLLNHVADRCPGPADPGPAAKWITRRDAQALGIQPMTLSRLSRSGRVRYRGTKMDRQYLLRDLAVGAARRYIDRRRR